MTWSVRQTRRFSRQYKKLNDNTAADVDSAVAEVAQNPEIGECKKRDLAALRVYKFRTGGQLYLLGYTLDEDIHLVYLEAVGPPRKLLSRLEALAEADRAAVDRRMIEWGMPYNKRPSG